MDHALRGGRAAPQTIEVFQRAAMDFCTRGGKRLGRRLRAGEAEHLMSRLDKFPNDGRADEAGGTGHQDTHLDLLWFMANSINISPDNVVAAFLVVNDYIL